MSFLENIETFDVVDVVQVVDRFLLRLTISNMTFVVNIITEKHVLIDF